MLQYAQPCVLHNRKIASLEWRQPSGGATHDCRKGLHAASPRRFCWLPEHDLRAGVCPGARPWPAGIREGELRRLPQVARRRRRRLRRRGAVAARDRARARRADRGDPLRPAGDAYALSRPERVSGRRVLRRYDQGRPRRRLSRPRRRLSCAPRRSRRSPTTWSKISRAGARPPTRTASRSGARVPRSARRCAERKQGRTGAFRPAQGIATVQSANT